MLFKIEKSGVTLRDKKLIEESLPTPKQYAGWKFKEYRWIDPSKLVTKHNGFTDNSVRRGGTPDSESLEELLRRGLDTTKLTISVCPDNNVINGFTRTGKLIVIGYREWIVAVYENDEDTKTEFQEDLEDYLDDMRLGANEGDGSTPASTEDFQEIGIKRFENRKDKSSLAVSRWVNSIPHPFSKKQVEGIANHVMKHHKRKGVVQKYSRDEAEKKIAKIAPNAEVLNTKSKTYMTRMFTEKIMPSVINGNGPVEFVTFHTDATTHKELDDGRNLSNKFLMKLHLGVEEYIDNYRENPVLGWANLGALAQKIGIEDPNKLA
tara:strand:- start:705 stop:1667 length:963 start_codon:yes stop_codon:yes gene_type:complete